MSLLVAVEYPVAAVTDAEKKKKYVEEKQNQNQNLVVTDSCVVDEGFHRDGDHVPPSLIFDHESQTAIVSSMPSLP